MKTNEKKDTEKKCRNINAVSKERTVRATHTWVVSPVDKRFSVCTSCGHAKKN